MTTSFGGSAAFVSHRHEWYAWGRRAQMRSSRIGIIFVSRVEAKQHDLWNYDKWGISPCACREQLVLDSLVAFTVDMKLTCMHTGSMALNVCGGGSKRTSTRRPIRSDFCVIYISRKTFIGVVHYPSQCSRTPKYSMKDWPNRSAATSPVV